MTETVEVEIEREAFEMIAGRAEYFGISPAEAIELTNTGMTPDKVPAFEGYFCRCPECDVWSRPPNCWRCGVDLDCDVGRDD